MTKAAAVLALADQGVSPCEIAAYLNLPPSRVRQITEARGWPIWARTSTPTESPQALSLNGALPWMGCPQIGGSLCAKF